MRTLESSYILSIYNQVKETSISGRWITLNHLKRVFSKYDSNEVIAYNEIGKSEENRPIHQFSFGNGKRKILIWTQMHGNESTGTKAVFDLLNYMTIAKDEFSTSIFNNCTIKIIPIVNPDGAEYYTRVNANSIDLNRDAVDRSAKESQLLRAQLDEFQPDFCFNLHDQRTIFGVEGTLNPATLSFLAPSEEITRKLTEGRKRTMNVIVAMNKLMQTIIPNHIGRYTDEFYPTATGDNFQKLGYPTVLIESGHYPEDYEREESRFFTFSALIQGIAHIASAENFDEFEEYFTIPDNSKNFRDLLHKYSNRQNEAFQYEEILENNKINFIPKKVTDDISALFFHKEIVFED
ncbi:M14 family zinc carboxypeptidase [Pseudotenacibaculum sp. MALMAid0570]|uniref:M14 family zinc carboxypeptidase n=1 Tax=Pseudotenacibaculum sp. MALMAid0570 TaxID=3143938 RepID=UPI0032DEC51B